MHRRNEGSPHAPSALLVALLHHGVKQFEPHAPRSAERVVVWGKRASEGVRWTGDRWERGPCGDTGTLRPLRSTARSQNLARSTSMSSGGAGRVSGRIGRWKCWPSGGALAQIGSMMGNQPNGAKEGRRTSIEEPHEESGPEEAELHLARASASGSETLLEYVFRKVRAHHPTELEEVSGLEQLVVVYGWKGRADGPHKGAPVAQGGRNERKLALEDVVAHSDAGWTQGHASRAAVGAHPHAPRTA